MSVGLRWIAAEQNCVRITHDYSNACTEKSLASSSMRIFLEIALKKIDKGLPGHKYLRESSQWQDACVKTIRDKLEASVSLSKPLKFFCP